MVWRWLKWKQPDCLQRTIGKQEIKENPAGGPACSQAELRSERQRGSEAGPTTERAKKPKTQLEGFRRRYKNHSTHLPVERGGLIIFTIGKNGRTIEGCSL